MYLHTLYLRNFRCYQESVFEFCPGINVIHGDNARGKTTLLEAIHVLITGSSFRPAQTTDLIRKGTDSFYIEAGFLKHGIEQTLKMFYNGKERKIFYNSTLCPSSASLLGLLQGVVMAPDDAALVKGAPAVRRRFLDLQIAQVDPLYVHHVTRYQRAMKQRNSLLRAKTSATLESWESEMASSAAYIVQQRLKAVRDLETNGRALHKTFSGEVEELSLGYKTGNPSDECDQIKSYYLAQYRKLRQREMIMGCTLVGPHKDDVAIAIGQQEARFFASEGQQRSCVAALRLGEWERLNTIAQEHPLMLIDDIGVGLDSSRREKLMGYLGQLGQVFVTSTEPLPVSSGLSIAVTR